MNENILRALMQFAALVAQINQSHFRKNAHALIKTFLEQKQGNKDTRNLLKNYLELYNNYVKDYESKINISEPGSINNYIQNICSSLIGELTLNERLILLFSLLELIQSDNLITNEESDFTRNVAVEFKINALEYEKAYDLIVNRQPLNIQSSDYCLISDNLSENSEELEGIWISKNKPDKETKFHSIHKTGLDGKIFIVRFKQPDLLALKYEGESKISLSQNSILPNKYYILDPYDQLYLPDSYISYHEISTIFKNESTLPKIYLSGFQISISKENKKEASDNNFSFYEESSNIICLLGENNCTSKILYSLAGRNQKLVGKIFLNGYNIYTDYHKIQKYIGFVPDYPLYSNNSTIYENLSITARLTFPKFPEKQVEELIQDVLNKCKIADIQNILPGTELQNFSPILQNFLTNLAIELIRKPALLFIQSPFDYLNVPDCEIILQILKTYIQNENLVIFSSFQPNTAILKLTDKLWIFDENNYIIYSGNTTDAFSYFKSLEPIFTFHEEQCKNCGTLNPELLYQIIQHKAVDENGKLTVRRKVSPEDWNNKYKTKIEKSIEQNVQRAILPLHQNSLPNIDTQFWLFTRFNFIEQIRKININLKELIFFFLIAIIIPLLMRSDWSNNYLFGKNPNIYPYITISALLLFIRGFVLSETENQIEKLKISCYYYRNLSYFSFLNAQITWWFFSSLFCSFIYSAIGCYILKFNNVLIKYWLLFFTICMLGCITGILVSNCSKRRSIAYFWLLLLISFNILFNGITINTKDYPNFLSSKQNVPLITDLAPAKWAFEAIVVDLSIHNQYEEKLYPVERKLEIMMFNANYLIPAIQKKLIDISQNTRKRENQKLLGAIQTEIKKLPEDNSEVFPFEYLDNLTPEKFNGILLNETDDYLTYMQIILSDQIRNSLEEKRKIEKKITDSIGDANYTTFKFANHNTFLYELISNSKINQSVLFANGIIVKQLNPLFIKPLSNFGRAHLFAPVKLFNKVYYNTFWFNMFILWFFIFAIYIITNITYFIFK
jgi:ABC transport system ATP-binding/permease protein